MIVNMQYHGYGNYGALGATSPVTQSDCPAGGSWEAWCDCMWPANKDAGMNSKCRAKSWGLLTAAPWTDVGAFQRGLPKPGGLIEQVVSIGGSLLETVLSPPTTAPPPPPPPPPSEGIMGAIKPIAYVGLGVMVLGVGALVIKRMSR